MNEIVIEIKTRPKFRPFVRAYHIAVSMSPLILGVIVDSQAMQVAGLFLFVLTAIALAAADTSANRGLTIDEARARLDEIQAHEAKP